MTKQSITAQTYLAQIYFDDPKIKNFALREFERCLRTGQLTAFVGSMATEGLGYPDWDGLLQMVPAAVAQVAVDDPDVVARFADHWKELKRGIESSGIDRRVTASYIGNWMDHETGRTDAGQGINSEVAKQLRSKTEPSPEAERDILAALVDDLGIRRFITTNYDMEIEFTIASALGDGPAQRHKVYDGDPEAAAAAADKLDLQRRSQLANGLLVASDAFERDRLDRLIEFTAGAPDVDFHVMHLHGRVDHPASMVVSYRDYDRLYRKAGVSKLPFDQALAMMYSTNPVLFVGFGMNDVELNRTLEELVGNQPFKGIGRRFLIWSSWALARRAREATERAARAAPAGAAPVRYDAEDVRRAFRLEKLHKLGVLTIFDDELPGARKRRDEPVPAEPLKRRRIAASLRRLARHGELERQRRLAEIEPTAWRRTDFKGSRSDRIINFTWHFQRAIDQDKIFGPHSIAIDETDMSAPLYVDTSRPGTNKGQRSTATAFAWSHRQTATGIEPISGRRVLFINTGLRLDTDSVLEMLYDFLFDQSGLDSDRTRTLTKRSREVEFRENDRLFLPAPGKEPLIIFRGLERLFSKTGVPLSAEVDGFFRCYVRRALTLHAAPPANGGAICRMLVFGTRRMRLYFRRIEEQVAAELKAERDDPKVKAILHVKRGDDSPDGYLRHLRRRFALDPVDPAAGDDDKPEPVRIPLGNDRTYARETYDKLFGSDKFRAEFAPGTKDERLAFAVLTVMAFIGQPVELEVLFHAPRVAQALESGDRAGELRGIVARLEAFELVSKIGAPTIEDDGKPLPDFLPRYALHLTLQAEMRERYGVPLSEAVLSTSFNMSLYASQPADGAIAEPSVHDELGRLIDWFLGVHKEKPMKSAHARGDPMGRPHTAAAFRAALAIVRGFYSTSSLLSLDLGDRRVDEQRDGALTEHANRLERIVRTFDKLEEARGDRARKFARHGEDRVKKEIGPGPIYPDELVWLHNELGVVKLAQGDLFQARLSLDEADRINRLHVEFDCRSHNWRRIWLNQLVVDIERGELTSAEDRIGRIENSIEPAGSVALIRRELREAKVGIAPDLPLEIKHEDCLAAALTTGYRGLIMHLRGEIHSAGEYYELAIEMLEKLDEQRACALFRTHCAALLYNSKGGDAANDMAKLAVAGAESVQQMDLAYRARIVRSYKSAYSDEAERRKRALLNFAQAIEFADLTDNHRLSVEARRAMAKLKLSNGDLESALEHASLAMALAGRYGMTLHMVALRIVLAQILDQRGAQEAAKALIQNAIAYADRIGYQRAVEGAQEALAQMTRG